MSDTHVSTHPSAPNTEVINVDDHDEDDNTEGRDQTAYRPTYLFTYWIKTGLKNYKHKLYKLKFFTTNNNSYY